IAADETLEPQIGVGLVVKIAEGVESAQAVGHAGPEVGGFNLERPPRRIEADLEKARGIARLEKAVAFVEVVVNELHQHEVRLEGPHLPAQHVEILAERGAIHAKAQNLGGNAGSGEFAFDHLGTPSPTLTKPPCT